MVPRARSAVAAALGGVLALAPGCSQSGPDRIPLDPGAAAVLADRADRVADALADGATCRALEEADALRERAVHALREGEAPESVIDETTRVVDAATADLVCDDADAGDEGAGDADAGGDGEGGDGEGDDAPTEPSPSPAPDPEPEPDPTPERGPDPEPDRGEGERGDGSGGGRGPDGDGPPGQDRGGRPGSPPGQGRGGG